MCQVHGCARSGQLEGYDYGLLEGSNSDSQGWERLLTAAATLQYASCELVGNMDVVGQNVR